MLIFVILYLIVVYFFFKHDKTKPLNNKRKILQNNTKNNTIYVCIDYIVDVICFQIATL